MKEVELMLIAGQGSQEWWGQSRAPHRREGVLGTGSRLT